MNQQIFKLPGVFNMIEVKVSSPYNHAYKAHLHSALSIGIIEKGMTILNVNGIEYSLGEGDAVIINPYVTHICQPVDLDNWSFTMIYIEESFYESNLNWPTASDLIGMVKLDASVFDKIRSLIETLKVSRYDFDREVELADTLNLILDSSLVLVEGNSTEISLAVRKYIEEHFLEILHLDSLVKIFNINKFTLIRQFKKAYHTTPSAYQLQLKVNFSKELLKANDNLTQVALESGFYDQPHFSHEFKKSFGISPLKYRQSLGEASISYNTFEQESDIIR